MIGTCYKCDHQICVCEDKMKFSHGNDILCCGCTWIYTSFGFKYHCKPDNLDVRIDMFKVKKQCGYFKKETISRFYSIYGYRKSQWRFFEKRCG